VDRVSDEATTQATFCATLVDEWARRGVRHAVISPGSRSTPLALALTADERIAVQVHHDERCAGFIGLGHGVGSGVPAVVLCTSGTAATHFHAAVVEAHHARVPLIVCTADRPPELRGVGAPQTIDQERLYGTAVRWFCDPGPPAESEPSTWRALAARAVAATADGPVHLNLPFREPLLGEPGELPPVLDPAAVPAPSAAMTTGTEAAARDGRGEASVAGGPIPFDPAAVAGLSGRRGVVVAGRGAGDAASIAAVAALLGWPVLADPLSGYDGPAAVHRADAILRNPGAADELRPEAVLRLGAPSASKVLGAHLGVAKPFTVHVGCDADPDRLASLTVAGDAASVVAALAGTELAPAPAAWTDRWTGLDRSAEAAIATVLAGHPEPTEPGTARTLLAALPAGAHLVVSSSMPVRDLEWYGTPRADVRVHSNRGANGIDGVLSTAIGVAIATGARTACLLGDVALLHDSNALVGITRRGVDLTVVVVDNDGGGIFSFLPQRGVLAEDRFEQLFGTPHGVRPESLAAAHDLRCRTVERMEDLGSEVAAATAAGGVHVLVVRTDRAANAALHDELNAAVSAAVAAG
jgi:2-succinyl-5-enolpyruvyl-6-hydroxy-3-cyclohexene-1-carboxylate synthase